METCLDFLNNTHHTCSNTCFNLRCEVTLTIIDKITSDKFSPENSFFCFRIKITPLTNPESEISTAHIPEFRNSGIFRKSGMSDKRTLQGCHLM